MVHSFLTSPLDRGVQIAFHPGNDAPVPTEPVAYPGILLERGGGSTNSVEDRGQRERGSGGGSLLSQGLWRQL